MITNINKFDGKVVLLINEVLGKTWQGYKALMIDF